MPQARPIQNEVPRSFDKEEDFYRLHPGLHNPSPEVPGSMVSTDVRGELNSMLLSSIIFCYSQQSCKLVEAPHMTLQQSLSTVACFQPTQVMLASPSLHTL